MFSAGGTLLKRKETSIQRGVRSTSCFLGAFCLSTRGPMCFLAFTGCFCRLLLPGHLLLYTLYFSGLFLLFPRKTFLWIQSRSCSVVSEIEIKMYSSLWIFLASAGEANANSQPCRSRGPGLWELNSFCGKTDGQTRIGVQEGRDSVVGGAET